MDINSAFTAFAIAKGTIIQFLPAPVARLNYFSEINVARRENTFSSRPLKDDAFPWNKSRRSRRETLCS